MKCTPLLKTVLDEVWAQIPGSTSDKEAAVDERSDELSAIYNALASTKKQVDYSDPVTRYVYLCCYVASHANMVCDRIARSDELSTLFESKDKVQIACICGGPGRDLIGVLKHVDNLDEKPRLKFWLYDRESAWADSWSDVDSKLEGEANTWFQQLDVTDPAALKPGKYLQADLFTMIYFASEIHCVRDDAEAYFEHLFENAKPGALFLYIDNAHSSFYEWFDERWKDKGVTLVDSSDSRTMQMETGEEKTELGEHFERVGKFKLKGQIAYRVLRKD